MALAYSLRLRRCSAGMPGSGRREAARSRDDSSAAVNAAATEAGGFGAVRGGIMPVRSLRTTFSHTSILSSTLATFIVSSARDPALTRSLWQVAQYCFRKAGSGVAAERAGGAPVCARTLV